MEAGGLVEVEGDDQKVDSRAGRTHSVDVEMGTTNLREGGATGTAQDVSNMPDIPEEKDDPESL